jgi:predicted nucleotidyltransferase
MVSPLPKLLRRTVERLIRSFAPERIVLFGSYAKGTNHAFSDFDLLVIAYFEGNMAMHQRRARQISADCFPPVDVVLCSSAEAADAARSPFLLSILGSGVTIYNR